VRLYNVIAQDQSILTQNTELSSPGYEQGIYRKTYSPGKRLPGSFKFISLPQPFSLPEQGIDWRQLGIYNRCGKQKTHNQICFYEEFINHIEANANCKVN
jgi:hypothetical protein